MRDLVKKMEQFDNNSSKLFSKYNKFEEKVGWITDKLLSEMIANIDFWFGKKFKNEKLKHKIK